MTRRQFLFAAPVSRILQTADGNGNRIPDFSNSGYRGANVPLPEVRAVAGLKPEAGDATARIQSAIDEVARHGGGALVLARGTYEINGTLSIPSGVILRGEGQGADGTVLLAAGKKRRTLITIGGAAAPELERLARRIKDDYVPVGARSFRVDDPKGLKPGDTVIVRRVGNGDWIRAIGMDRIKPRPTDPGSTKQWQPFDLDFDRVVTAVEGDRITVDAPITCAIETRWGGGFVIRYRAPLLTREAAVENLRGVSVFDRSVTARLGRDGETYFADEDHCWSLIGVSGAENCWVQQVTALHMGYACVEIRRAKWVTVRDCFCGEMVSQITGSRRYSFSVSGQLCLVEHCQAETGRHDFAVGARVCGPNVFLECRARKAYAYSEPHHRWSVGGLYDNVHANIAVQDRQYYGTGHGWAGANYVLWNCEGDAICQKPPTAQNWAIGHVGRKLPGAFAPREDGHWEFFGRHVEPKSLYRWQLSQRLGNGSSRGRG